MSGTPANSPAAWRGAGKTCTCTCPDPPSLCGCRHPACLARGGGGGRAKWGRAASGLGGSPHSPEVILCLRITHIIPHHPEQFSVGLCSLAGGRIMPRACMMSGFAGPSFCSVSTAFAAQTWVCASPVISLQAALSSLYIPYNEIRKRESHCTVCDRRSSCVTHCEDRNC